jgi:pimeloyl-ACP methyl ester carboxylesterase
MQPGIRDRVRFVMSVGGYYSLQNVIAYLTTGYPGTTAAVEGALAANARPRPPHPYGVAVFIRSNLDLLARSVDRGFMRSYADYLVGENGVEDEPLPGALAPDARAFYQLLTNPDPTRVPPLVESLPERIRAQLEGIDPSARDLAQLKARVILLHGRGDNLVPYTESITLAKALPENQAQLHLIDGLAHVDLKPASHDIPQLLAALEALLAVRTNPAPDAGEVPEPPPAP